MYTVINFQTKKQLKEAVARYLVSPATSPGVEVYEPGIQTGKRNGRVFLEGPHYPQPHKWYAEAEIVDGIVVKVK